MVNRGFLLLLFTSVFVKMSAYRRIAVVVMETWGLSVRHVCEDLDGHDTIRDSDRLFQVAFVVFPLDSVIQPY